MAKITAKLPVQCTILLIAALNSHMGARAADKPGWLLTQSAKVLGARKMYIGPQGEIKILERQGCAIVCAGPDWQPRAYNLSTGTKSVVNPKTWERTFALLYSFQIHLDGNKLKYQGLRRLGQQKVRWFVYEPSADSPVKRVEYFEAPEIEINPKAASTLAQIDKLPLTKYAPLRLTFYNRRGEPEQILDTTKISRESLPKDFFICPKNLRSAPDMEVITGSMVGDVLSDMTGSLGKEIDARQKPSSKGGR